jgi:hypothetical protein
MVHDCIHCSISKKNAARHRFSEELHRHCPYISRKILPYYYYSPREVVFYKPNAVHFSFQSTDSPDFSFENKAAHAQWYAAELRISRHLVRKATKLSPRVDVGWSTPTVAPRVNGPQCLVSLSVGGINTGTWLWELELLKEILWKFSASNFWAMFDSVYVWLIQIETFHECL